MTFIYHTGPAIISRKDYTSEQLTAINRIQNMHNVHNQMISIENHTSLPAP